MIFYRYFISILFFFLICQSVHSQKNFWDLNPTQAITCRFEIDSLNAPLSEYSFLLMKKNNVWYAIGDGTGLVYRREINETWKKIDSTKFGGYHFGANLFVYNDTFFKYGGYGFWRNNGYFVEFLSQRGEWEIKPTNIELPSNQHLLFLDPTNSALYNFGVSKHNQVSEENSIQVDSLFRINLTQMKWENLGSLTDEFIKEVKSSERSETVSNDDLCLILGNNLNTTPYLINFRTLEFSSIDCANNLSKVVERMRNPEPGTILLADKEYIYLLDLKNYQIIDSISWQEIVKFKNSPQSLLTYKSNLTLYASIAISLLILSILVIRKAYNRRKNLTPYSDTLSNELIFLTKNRIRFKGAIYKLNELDIRHLKLITSFQEGKLTLPILVEMIAIQSKHLELSEEKIIHWIQRMNAFFITIGMNQAFIQLDNSTITLNPIIIVSNATDE
jgi:hypothetical protein